MGMKRCGFELNVEAAEAWKVLKLNHVNISSLIRNFIIKEAKKYARKEN